MGLFSTSSVERRVRWRGQLDDPNDLAVFIGAVLPFLFAAAVATKRKLVAALAFGVIGLELYCVVLTQSRGGQIMIATMVAAYLVGRFRSKGALGVLVALPVLLLVGGRDGGESSTAERKELLYDGLDLALQHPIFGVGINGFLEELHGLTAHNAYLLAAAELGLPGMFFWTGLLWASLKIPFTIGRRPPDGLDPGVRMVALALIVSLVGMGVGIFFLSFTFKLVLFVWLGMCGALYGSVLSAHPGFRVGVGLRDCVGIVGFVMVLLGALFAYTRLVA
jgi:O-antigen ligase